MVTKSFSPPHRDCVQRHAPATKPRTCSATQRSRCIALNTTGKHAVKSSTTPCTPGGQALAARNGPAQGCRLERVPRLLPAHRVSRQRADCGVRGSHSLAATQGMVMPNDFIPLADETGIILSINRQLMPVACQQLRTWQRLFPSDPPLSLSVNISPKQFAQADLPRQISQLLQQAGWTLDASIWRLPKPLPWPTRKGPRASSPN